MNKRPRIFLSYSNSDLKLVERLFLDLTRHGLEVWYDKAYLEAGPWLEQVEKAIYRSNCAIFCLSSEALRKLQTNAGVQQHEISVTYEIARKLPPSEFTIVPVRFEDCDRGDHRLATSQQFDLFDDWERGVQRLVTALGIITPDDSRVYRAEALFLRGDFVSSFAAWEAIEAVAGATANTRYYKGACMFNLKRYTEALEFFESSEALGDPTEASFFAKAQTQLTLKKFDAAVASFRSLIRRFPANRNAALLLERAKTIQQNELLKGPKASIDRQDYGDAVQALNEFLRQYLSNVEAHALVERARKIITTLSANSRSIRSRSTLAREACHSFEPIARRLMSVRP